MSESMRKSFESANPVPFGVFWSAPDSRYMTSMVHLNCIEYNGKWLGWQSAVLAQEAGPVVERQEPAFYRVRGLSADGSKGEWRLSNIYPLHMSYEAEPLYTSPPAPVAVMLEMSQLLQECVNVVRFGYDLDLPVTTMNRIDACLDKVKELNQ